MSNSSGFYEGDSQNVEVTNTLYMTNPWVIEWKCIDTNGAMMFTVNDTQDNVIEMYGSYQCVTDVQTITIHHSGALRIGAIPLDGVTSFYFGGAEV